MGVSFSSVKTCVTAFLVSPAVRLLNLARQFSARLVDLPVQRALGVAEGRPSAVAGHESTFNSALRRVGICACLIKSPQICWTGFV